MGQLESCSKPIVALHVVIQPEAQTPTQRVYSRSSTCSLRVARRCVLPQHSDQRWRACLIVLNDKGHDCPGDHEASLNILQDHDEAKRDANKSGVARW